MCVAFVLRRVTTGRPCKTEMKSVRKTKMKSVRKIEIKSVHKVHKIKAKSVRKIGRDRCAKMICKSLKNMLVFSTYLLIPL